MKIKNNKTSRIYGDSVEWDKEEGTSKAKSRTRNIIVFNENNLEEIDLEFTFDDRLKKRIYS